MRLRTSRGSLVLGFYTILVVAGADLLAQGSSVIVNPMPTARWRAQVSRSSARRSSPAATPPSTPRRWNCISRTPMSWDALPDSASYATRSGGRRRVRLDVCGRRLDQRLPEWQQRHVAIHAVQWVAEPLDAGCRHARLLASARSAPCSTTIASTSRAVSAAAISRQSTCTAAANLWSFAGNMPIGVEFRRLRRRQRPLVHSWRFPRQRIAGGPGDGSPGNWTRDRSSPGWAEVRTADADAALRSRRRGRRQGHLRDRRSRRGRRTLDIVEAFDTATGQWQTVESLPVHARRSEPSPSNGLVYAIGGRNGIPFSIPPQPGGSRHDELSTPDPRSMRGPIKR